MITETETKTQIRVLIADDHPIFRQGLRHAFSEVSDMKVVGEAATVFEVLEKIRENSYDIVLLDVSMGGNNTLDTLKQMKIECPKLPVLVLSVFPEDHFAIRFIKSGASGYITKEEDPDTLMAAVRKIAKGGRYTSPELTEKLAFDFADQNKPPHEYLSDREYQVFGMLVTGKSLTKIAEKLSLSVKTISTHRTHILEKMKMSNNAQLIQYAIRDGLVQ
jgi:two-component system, NarL family, invasion response regulator UvrY